MVVTISGLLAVMFYSLGSVYQSQILSSNKNNRNKVLLFGLLAILSHTVSVYGVINTPQGYHFGFFKIATLISLSIAILVLISSFKKPLENLFLGLFPLAIVCIIASLTLHSPYNPSTSISAGMLSHILLSILAFSLISIAALQALFLAYQNHQLKHKNPTGLVSKLPPLQTMEMLLFELLWVGITLLSLSILSGILYLQNIFAQHLVHKTVLSIIAWCVFAVLLWGRHYSGWRGSTAIRGTLVGFAFLVLSYFGSKFVLELILERL